MRWSSLAGNVKKGKAIALTAKYLLGKLEKMHPGARIELKFSSPLELLVAVILSAQCTDKKVNEVSPALFSRYRTAADYAAAPPGELEQLIRQTGFFNAKARNIRGACRVLVEKFGGRLPRTMAELVLLPGVARKTGNVILAGAFNIAEGMAVDTHVGRVSCRLGLTKQKDPVKIEADLIKFFPPKKWMRTTELLVFLGRYTCKAKAPDCPQCLLSDRCPSSLV